uniref:Uncharacterized protein n=1 Tax=Steinernema glaseri TaxID=37863 RepID=A0A1I7YY37_9BILA
MIGTSASAVNRIDRASPTFRGAVRCYVVASSCPSCVWPKHSSIMIEGCVKHQHVQMLNAANLACRFHTTCWQYLYT